MFKYECTSSKYGKSRAYMLKNGAGTPYRSYSREIYIDSLEAAKQWIDNANLNYNQFGYEYRLAEERPTQLRWEFE